MKKEEYSIIFSKSSKEVFRKYVTKNFDQDRDGILSSDELNSVTKIDVQVK